MHVFKTNSNSNTEKHTFNQNTTAKVQLFASSLFILPHPRWHMIWTPAPFDLVGMLVDIGRPEAVEVYRCQESYKICPGR